MNIRTTFTMAMFLLLSLSINAQTTDDWGWSWKDSAVVPAKRMEQHQRFLRNEYPYPAKPRTMWELGLSAGPSMVIGDVKSKVGIGGGLSLRKSLSHIFSARLSYFGSLNKGTPTTYGASIGQKSYENYTHMAGIDVIASLANLSYYRGNPKMDLYVLGGYSFITTRVSQPNAAGLQKTFYGQGIPNTQAGLLGTVAGTESNNRKSWSMLSGLSTGAGISFKINKRVNVGVEQRFTFAVPGYDYLDGFKAGNSNDFYSYSSAHINFNIGNSSKKVEPLYWLNPNNFIYSELNKPAHMKLPKPVLEDADGDGITDQFDLEPNTPAGAKVDSHGRALDTDGDGVPDYKDKEILTPQKWFPVNNDGVGTPPEPACCKELKDELGKVKDDLANGKYGKTGTDCGIGNLPSIKFNGNAKLTKEAQSLLSVAAQKIMANPTCKVKVVGYGASDKKAQQNSWERVNAVIKYLVEKQGISESRLIFSYGLDGDNNTVDLQGTTEDGPNTVPAPHPNLKS